MTSSNKVNPIVRMQRLWQQLQHLPGGSWLFSRMLGWMIPYSGTIGANVKILKPGYAQIQMRDRRRVRNHLHSIHALALCNLGELTSGLAMLTGLSATTRGIPIKISIEYYKKARGNLLAESTVVVPTVTKETEFEIYTDIRDADGDIVARTTVNWRLGPIPEKP
ncbi:MAG: hotdog fold domain-containing protein [Thiohalomonadales bacterium]